MKNAKDESCGKLKKCPYQVSVYGENSCELIYRSNYKGDWGDWDEIPTKNKGNEGNDGEPKEKIDPEKSSD